MISLNKEIVDSGNVYAFKKVFKNIPSSSKRVEVSYCEPTYDIEIFLPGLITYRIQQNNHLIEIEGLYSTYNNGEFKISEFHELIEMPIGLYRNRVDVEKDDIYLRLKIYKM